MREGLRVGVGLDVGVVGWYGGGGGFTDDGCEAGGARDAVDREAVHEGKAEVAELWITWLARDQG